MMIRKRSDKTPPVYTHLKPQPKWGAVGPSPSQKEEESLLRGPSTAILMGSMDY